MNDGKCTSMTEDDGSFACECPSGFRGKQCEISPPQMYLMTSNITLNTRPSKIPSTAVPTTGDFTDDLMSTINDSTETTTDSGDGGGTDGGGKKSPEDETDNEAL